MAAQLPASSNARNKHNNYTAGILHSASVSSIKYFSSDVCKMADNSSLNKNNGFNNNTMLLTIKNKYL